MYILCPISRSLSFLPEISLLWLHYFSPRHAGSETDNQLFVPSADPRLLNFSFRDSFLPKQLILFVLFAITSDTRDKLLAN